MSPTSDPAPGPLKDKVVIPPSAAHSAGYASS